jgi:5-methylcytosine-specific restriction endonuclease McrA
MAGDLRDRTFITRPEAMAEARKLGTHTAAQWHAKERGTTECRYCSTPLSYWNTVKDHKTSILRGGSDSIDNIQAICWECNIEKGTTDADEFTHTGTSPRPFRVMPDREPQYRAAVEQGDLRG